MKATLPILTILSGCLALANAFDYDAATDGTTSPAGVNFTPFSTVDPLNPVVLGPEDLAIYTLEGFSGLGIDSGNGFLEINSDESLVVTFDTPRIVSSLSLAFLFDGPEFTDANEVAAIGAVVDGLTGFAASLTAETETTAAYDVEPAVDPGTGEVGMLSPAVVPGGAGVWRIDYPFGYVPIQSFSLAGGITLIEDPDNPGSFIEHPGDFSLHAFATIAPALEQVDDLEEELEDLPVDRGTKNSLQSKLSAADAALASGNQQAACGSLNALLNQIRAQRGKKLTVAQADELTTEVIQLRLVIGCQ